MLGGPSASLKGDADAGRIELDIGGTTYTKEYSRRQGPLVSQETQFTDRGERVELFARLLGDNPARRAVERGEDLKELREERSRLQNDLDEVEKHAEGTEELRESDPVETYQQLSEHEYERGQLESERKRVEDEIAEIEELDEERQRLEAQREHLVADLESLRSRIDDLEETAVEQFNTHMESVLELLEYSNLARVWIERIQSDERGEDAALELHIVRETEDGPVYEGMVDNLSESERKVVGLVVALARYLVHDVHQVVPFMLLDSLEAIDSERIAALVDYFANYVPFLLVALLPEDANAISDEYERLSADALV